MCNANKNKSKKILKIAKQAAQPDQKAQYGRRDEQKCEIPQTGQTQQARKTD